MQSLNVTTSAAAAATSTPKSVAEGGTPISPEAMIEQLRLLRLQVPDYAQLTNASASSLRRAASVDPHFVQASINIIGASPTLQSTVGRTAEGLRQETDEAARWEAVEEELKALLKGVSAANLTRRHRIGLVALQTLHISRQLARGKEHADLLPQVQEMKRLNRLGKRKPPVPEVAKKPIGT